jgi:tape measure domain-containing protein
VPDTMVRAQIAVVGADQALAQLRAYRSELAGLGQLRNRVVVETDTVQARQQLAEMRAITQRMNAETARIRVNADIEPATQAIRALDAETRALTARARVMKLEVDNSQAMQQLRAYEAETRRIQALSRQPSGGGAAGSFALGGASGVRGLVSGEIGGGIPGVAAAAGVLAFGAGLTAAAQASVDLNSRLQQATITFTTFLGSTDAANQHLRELARFAAATPFQFPDLVQASVRMQAMGFAARDVIPDLRAIGDAEAALGGGKEGIDRVVLALGQMQTKGHVAGQEILQLTEAGIPALQYLAEAYGKTTAEIDKMISAGKVDAGTGVQAILAGLAADPRFAGMMDQQSRSFAGSMSNITDSAQMALAKGLRPLFDELNSDATALAAFTASSEFTKWADDFATAVHDDVSALKEMGAVMSAVADNPFVGLVAKALEYGNVLKGINELSQQITGNEATRGRVDAYARGGGDLDAMKAAAQARLEQLRAQQPGNILGVANPFDIADNKRAIQQEQETLDEVDRLIERQRQQRAVLDSFKGGLGFAQAGYDKAATNAMTSLIADVTNGRMSAEEARGSFDLLARTFGQFVPNIDAVAAAFHDKLTAAILDSAKATNVALSAQEQYQARLIELAKYQALGASNEDISRGVFQVTGTGDEATAFQVQQAQANLAKLDAAAKAAEADFIRMRDAAVGAVAKIDLSKGIAGLAALHAELARANEDLAKVGGQNAALSDLVRLTAGFDDVAKAEDRASEAYRGYMLLFDESDQRIRKIEAIKKAYDDLADAADRKRAGGGTLTAQEQTTLADRTAVDANLQNMIDNLRAGQAGDINLAVQVVPNYEKFDQMQRDEAAKVGGGPAIVTRVEADTAAAKDEIAKLIKPDVPYQIVIPVTYTYPDGQPAGPPLPGGGASPKGFSGGAPPPGGNFSYEDYSRVVGNAPIAGRENYDTLLQVANELGVDARQLLAVMQTESDYGRTAGRIGEQYNYGGMGVNDRGFGHDSGIHATDGGPEYQGYDSFRQFLEDLGRWVREHKGDFSSYQTADGGQAKASAYANLQQQLPTEKTFPGAYGGGGDIGDAGQLASQSNAVRARIIAKAMQDLDVDKMANECEKWVEETIEAITGKRGATGQREFDANAGLRDAQAQGLEVSQAQAKPGDLVYYGDSKNGHVAVFVGTDANGDGQQISTYDKGDVNDAQARKIHIEAVGPGAKFINSLGGSDQSLESAPVKVPIIEQREARTANVANSVPGGNTVNARDPNTDAAAAALAKERGEAQALTASFKDVKIAQDGITQSFAHMDSTSIAAARKEYESLLPLLQKAETAKLPDNADAAQKQTALNEGMAKAIGLADLWGQGVQAIADKSGKLPAIEKEIAAAGGDVGANLAAQLGLYQNIAAINDRIAALTARKGELEAQHNGVLSQRQQEDAADAAAQTATARREQDAATARDRAHTMEERRIQDIRTAEGERYQDETTAIQRAQAATQQRWGDEETAINRAHAAEQQLFADEEQGIARAHAAQQQQWADDETAINRAHAAEQQLWRDEDQAAARAQTLQQRAERDADQAIARQHAALQRMWADEARADEAARAARDAAWTAQQRAEEDAKYNLGLRQTAESRAMQDRIDALTHDGTLKKQALQAELQGNEDRTKAVTAGNAGAEALASAKVEGSATNAGAQAAAEELALRKQQDTQALKALDDQKTAIQQAIDAEDKLASEQLYNLQQEQKALDRAHQDAMAALDREATLAARLHDDQERAIAQEITDRNNQHAALEQEWADEAQAIADVRQAARDRYEDEQFAIQQARQATTDQWAAEAQARQDAHEAIMRQWALEAQNRQDAQAALLRQWAAEAQNRQDTQTALTRQWAAEAQARDDAHTALLRNQATEDTARRNAYDDQTFQISETQRKERERHEDARAQIVLTRNKQDDLYNAAQKALSDEITAQGKLAQEEQGKLGNAQAAIGKWGEVGNAAEGAAQRAINAWNAAFSSRQSGDSAPAPHADGGTITTKYALVGERGPEIISAPGYDVRTAPETAALLAPRQAAPVQITRGATTYNITVTAQPGQSPEAIAALVRRAIEEHERETSDTAYAAALGMARN